MYNPNAITIVYRKPVNYNISPRRGIRRDVGSVSVPGIEYLADKVAEINARPGCCVFDAFDMGGKRIKLEVVGA